MKINEFLTIYKCCVQVTGIKSDLSGLGDGVEEFRAMCRQLQSLMRRIPDCIDAPFESEADTLMDRWLDVCYICPLSLSV